MSTEIVADTSDYAHTIFKTDPVKLKEMINKEICVKMKLHSRVIQGTVYVIDPASETIVLLNKKDDKMDMDLVIGTHIESIEIIGQSDIVISDNLFKNENKQVVSTSAIKKRRDKLFTWLQHNMIPIIKDGDLIKVQDALIISPPYQCEDCYSNNEIILEKIQKLIISM